MATIKELTEQFRAIQGSLRELADVADTSVYSTGTSLTRDESDQLYSPIADSLHGKLITLDRIAFRADFNDVGAEDTDGEPFMDENWPAMGGFLSSDDAKLWASINNLPEDTDVINERQWHVDIAGPIVKEIQSLVVKISGNLDSLTTGDKNPADYFLFSTGKKIDWADLPDKLNEFLNLPELASYLSGLGIYFSNKADIDPAPDLDDKPRPIPVDSNMASTLAGQSSKHYIAFLLDENKSDGDSGGYYIPIRYSPYNEGQWGGKTLFGWNDENYSIIDDDGEYFDPQENWKSSNGVVLPQGLGVFVTEIVDSKTGVWVGFVFDPEDPKYDDDWDDDDGLTKGKNLVLYTRPEFLRSTGADPDPMLSHKVVDNEGVWHAINESLSAARPSIKKIDPPKNDNWLNLFPEEAVLYYYNFTPRNRSGKAVYELTPTGILNDPAMRYSEGYFYFILGEAPGPNGQDAAKDSAWKNLLKYFNKESLSDDLQARLKQDFFVQVASRLNTNSSSVNNQKVLFAIRASYIDALPDSTKIYLDNFDLEDPIEASYSGGRNYAITMYTTQVREVCDELKDRLSTIKEKAESSGQGIIDANGQPFDIQPIADFLSGGSDGDFPGLLADFLGRQAFPRATKQDFISDFVKEAATSIVDPEGDNKHLVQIGLRDNGQIGEGVRLTISYVLFSPDPKKLKEMTDKGFQTGFNLFYFDPYITEEERKDDVGIRRSAVPLQIGLTGLRKSFEGVYGSMSLNFIHSYPVIMNPSLGTKLREDADIDWATFLGKYTVPPLKIPVNRSITTNTIEGCPDDTSKCDEWINQLNKSSNVWGIEERLLMEKIDRCCKESYFDQFKKSTPASDPEMTKKSLEGKSSSLDNLDDKVTEIIPKQIKFLYRTLMNNIDVEGIIALIMACLSSKLGIPMTAEAICEAAILQLVQQLGIDKVEEALLANAQGNPAFETLAASLGDRPGSASTMSVDGTFDNAPIATFLVLLFQDSEGDRPSWLTAANIAVVKQLEQNNVSVALVPGPRPDYDDTYDKIAGVKFPPGAVGSALSEKIFDAVYDEEIELHRNYTIAEIDAERDSLLDLGYTEEEAEALLVYRGYLVPDETLLAAPLSGAFLDPAMAALDESIQDSLGTGINDELRNVRATFQDAKNWLDYVKSVISLQELCELLVGSLLAGFEDLLKDPLGFLTTGSGDWWDNFLDSLKRKFSFPEPTFRFPDSLRTDTHMGDYGKKLLETLLTMVVIIVAQILNVVIKDALSKCFEEADNDDGPANNPIVPGLPSVSIPGLDSLLSGKAPKIAGQLPFAAASDLMDDLLSGLSHGQLCSLLRGEASKQTLYDLLQVVISKEAQLTETVKLSYIYRDGISPEEAELRASKDVNSSLRSMSDIKNMFTNLSKEVDLELCDALAPTATIIDDMCVAFYDREGKLNELTEAGLTEEEANKQIDDNLEALKNKIFTYAPALFPGSGGVGSSMAAIPDICETEGAFQTPPGVDFAMDLITDNILSTVKGSLIQDMSALKFFAVPPRAILAVSSPEAIKETQQMFREAITKPNQKKCLAIIRPPRRGGSYWSTGTEYWASMSIEQAKAMSNPDQEQDMQHLPVYPLVYDGANFAYGNFNKASSKSSYPEEAYKGTMTTEEAKGTLRWSDSELKHILQEIIDNRDYIEPDAAQHDFFKPMSINPLLINEELFVHPSLGSKITENIKNMLLDAPDDIQPDIADLLGDESIESMSGKDLCEKVFQGFGSSVEIYIANKLEENFNKIVKPKNISEMVFEAGYLQNSKLVGISKESGIKKYYGGSNIEVKLNVPHPISLDDQAKFKYVNKVYSLDTKLKEIKLENPIFEQDVFGTGVWSRMFMNYMGLAASLNFPKQEQIDFIQFGNPSEYTFNTDPESWSKDNPPISKGVCSDKIKECPGIIGLLPHLTRLFDSGEPIEKVVIYQAFMELTLGEAIGMTDERIRLIYPNFSSTNVDGVILEMDEEGKLSPLYVVFTQVYLDPESPLYADPKDMIKHFSGQEDPVNPELFQYLTNDEFFPQLLGYRDGKTSPDQIWNSSKNYHRSKNYNPNILRYDLPFTEITAPGQPSAGGATLDSSKKTQDILKIFQGDGTGTGITQIDSLIESLQIDNKNNSLIYQNTLGPSRSSLSRQLGAYKDVFRSAKGKLVEDDNINANIPPSLLHDVGSIKNELFDIKSVKEVDEDVKNLLGQLFDEDTIDPVLAMQENFKNTFVDITTIQTHINLKTPGADNAYELDSLNFKAQIFGKLLTKKFFDKFDDYKIPNMVNYGYDFDLEAWGAEQQFIKRKLEYIFSTHGYSSLQYAYSNQMMAKLKRSRLQQRGLMRKLWDKILDSPLGGVSNPACRDLINQIGAMTSEDIRNSQTDFFNIEGVKTEIKNYYKSALCRDVYEKNSAEENAVRISLLQGVVKLMIKVYTLEMCIASVIAWDSFNIDEVFNTDIMVNVIRNNIEKDAEKNLSQGGLGLDHKKLALYAKEIIRKEYKIADEEAMARLLDGRSALAYLISLSAIDVSTTVRGIFQNSEHISADLNLEILKNSDTNFIDEYNRKVRRSFGPQGGTLPEWYLDAGEVDSSSDPEIYKKLYDSGYDYVVDARFKDNIYTLNYGSGEVQDLLEPFVYNLESYDTTDASKLSERTRNCKEYINLYGYNEDSALRSRPGRSKSRNFFHSLPYNYYTPIVNKDNTEFDNGWAPEEKPLSHDDVISTPRGSYGLEDLDEFTDSFKFTEDYSQPLTSNDVQGDAPSSWAGHFHQALWNYKPPAGDLSSIEPPHHSSERYKRFIKINDLMTTYLGRADAFNKEMYNHTQIGNIFNGMLGNVTFQPYVKITDWKKNDLDEDSYRGLFDVDYFQPIGGEIQHSKCDPPYRTWTTPISDFDISGFLEAVNKIRAELNIFNAYIFDYVPLAVWSHFYTEVFLRLMNESPWNGADGGQNIKDVYDAHGFAPFFKEIKFGLRLNYSTTLSVDQSTDLLFKDFMKKSFGPQNNGLLPGDPDKDFAAVGLKKCKTLLGQRPYYVPGNDALGGQQIEDLENNGYKICDEIQIPIVEVEREIVSVSGEQHFVLKNLSSDSAAPNIIFPLDLLGHYDPEIYDIFDGTTFNLQAKLDAEAVNEDKWEEYNDAANKKEEEFQALIDQWVHPDWFKATEETIDESTGKEKYLAKLVEFFETVWKVADNPGDYTGTDPYRWWPTLGGNQHKEYGWKLYGFDQSASYEWNARLDRVMKIPAIKELHPDYDPETDSPEALGAQFLEDVGWFGGSLEHIQDYGRTYGFGRIVYNPDQDEWSEQAGITPGNQLIVEGISKELWNAAVDASPYPINYFMTTDFSDSYIFDINNNNGNPSATLDEFFGFTPKTFSYGFTPEPNLVDVPPGVPVIPSLGDAVVADRVIELASQPSSMKHLTNNFHQFFYKNLAQSMVNQLKTTPEFKLMYDHLFPMRRYMTLSFMLAGDSLSKFIPEPTDILSITKDHISMAVQGLESALEGDYTFLPPAIGDHLTNQMQAMATDTQAVGPNLEKQIMMIILRTPLLILKGFVETTDFAIIIAKSILNVANAIQQGIISAIETGIRAAKQATQAAKDVVKTTMNQIESDMTTLVIPIQVLQNTMVFPVELPQEGQQPKLAKDLITINVDGDISAWEINVEPLPEDLTTGEDPVISLDNQTAWAKLQNDVEEIQALRDDYVSAKNEFEDLDIKLKENIAKLESDLAKAKKVMKDLFQSPFLLPGMWAAMLPSYVPFGGGIPPLPVPFPGVGPPSTVPGMIYIALLFLDAWEETQHRQSELADDSAENAEENCKNEL